MPPSQAMTSAESTLSFFKNTLPEVYDTQVGWLPHSCFRPPLQSTSSCQTIYSRVCRRMSAVCDRATCCWSHLDTLGDHLEWPSHWMPQFQFLLCQFRLTKLTKPRPMKRSHWSLEKTDQGQPPRFLLHVCPPSPVALTLRRIALLLQ